MSDDKSKLNILFSEVDKLINLQERSIPIILPFIPSLIFIMMVSLGFLITLPFSIQSPFIRVSVVSLTNDLFLLEAILWLSSLIVTAYLIYLWIDSLNKHKDRAYKLYSNIAEIASILGFERIVILKSRLNELAINTNKKSVSVNVVLGIIIPFYVLYILHSLNKDLVKHSINERLLLFELIEEIKKKDTRFVRSINDYNIVEDRSTFVYIILSLVTLGIFLIYWYYAVTKDYNNHILLHKQLDNEIVEGLRRIFVTS